MLEQHYKGTALVGSKLTVTDISLINIQSLVVSKLLVNFFFINMT